jgi:hypothetical protein
VVRVRVRRWLAAAAWMVVWLLAVAVVAGVAWFAIDSAGREVAGGEDAVTLVSAAQQPPASGTTSRSSTAVRPAPTTLGAERPGSGRSRLTPSVPGSGGGRTGTYSSASGDLAVRCLDDTVTGWALRTADGWRAEAALAGGSLHVLFVAGDGRMAGVQAHCHDGDASFAPTRQPSRS